MTDHTTALEWRGRTLVDDDGDKIGTIDEIYLDDETGRPEWLTVNTGLFGTKSSFVPLAEARADGGDVRVPYPKSTVKDAPGVDADQHLSPQEEQELYRYYGVAHAGAGTHDTDAGVRGTGVDTGRRDTDRDVVGRDTSGPTTDDAMTRSEEELEVGKSSRETGKARLRKHVVTEHVETTVPVQREEVRLEREPITDANVGPATDGPAISEEEHEVTLHEEEVVVGKRTVPKERVRLDTETVTDQETVSDEVRKERVEAEGVDERRR